MFNSYLVIFSKKLHLVFALLFAIQVSVKAQSSVQSTSKVIINSNYDSFYVLIGDSTKNAELIESGELLTIESGDQKLWIVPEYSNPFSVQDNFEEDSVYVINLTFRSILKDPSEIYSRIQKEDSTFKSLEFETISFSNRTYSIEKFTTSDYEQFANIKPDYKDTYAKVVTNVDSLYINTSNAVDNTQRIANGDSVLIYPGMNIITLSHEKSVERTVQKIFSDSTTTTINHDFKLNEPTVESLKDNIATEPTYSSNLIVVSDEDSEIIVNENHFAKGALSLNLDTGPIKVLIENPHTGTTEINGVLLNTLDEKSIVLDAYTKPSIGTSRFFGLFPGASQIYKRQKIKGYSITGAFLLSGYFAINKNKEYGNELNNFEALEAQYNRATDEQTALELGNQLERQQRVVKEKDNQRLALFALTGAIYAFNIYDAIFTKPEGGFRTKTDIDFYLNNEVVDNNRYTTLSLRYDF